MSASEYPAQPTVSVCIANYNGECLLDECIQSIRSQDYEGAIEILVHDDASTDASLRVLSENHSDVVVVRSSENVGYCISNNRLAAAASGRYLLLLNNDAKLKAGALRALAEDAQRDRGLFATTLPQYDWKTGALVDLGVRLDLLHTPVPNQDLDCNKLAYVQGACLFIRREDWLRLGGFPEWMQSNAEDVYICSLVRLAGGAIRVVVGSGYEHRQGTSFGGNRPGVQNFGTTYRRRYLSERNRAGMILVCTPTHLAWGLYGLQLALLLLEGVLFWLVKRDRRALVEIYLSAVRDSFTAIPQLRAERRRVQGLRKIGLLEYLRILSPIPQKLRILLRRGIPELH